MAKVDLHNSGLPDDGDFKSALRDAGFGPLTTELDLSANRLRLVHLMDILAMMRVFSKKLPSRLVRLNLNHNDFDPSEHLAITLCCGDIFKQMGRGKERDGFGVLFTEGNNDIMDFERRARRAFSLMRPKS